jgi:restriction endonuclease S subunit
MVFSIIQKSQLEGTKRLDAEYYQPEYLELINKLNVATNKRVLDFADNITRKFEPQKNKYFDYIEISEVDLKDGTLNAVKILGGNAPDRAQKIVKEGDIIISMVRPNRNAVSFVWEGLDNFVASSGFCVLNPKNISSEYLFVYLKTNHVIKLLERKTSASLYPAVTEEDILNLPLYIVDEKEIIIYVHKFRKLMQISKLLYSQAENLLLTGFELKNFEGGNSLISVVNLSDVQTAGRLDAEYYNSPCNKMLDQMKEIKTAKLGDLVVITKGIEPGAEAYRNEGKLFIRVSSISKDGIIDKDQKYLSEDLYDKYKIDYQPQVGEILLTKDASIGVACVVREPIGGIVSGGVLRLKLKEKMHPEYLALVLNSIVGQLQAERDAGGSIIAHWKPEQIKNLIVPILPISTQEKIADLMVKSHEARKKAKELLEEAKRKVEEMIEKGGDNYDSSYE